jgi:hypothetical protein
VEKFIMLTLVPLCLWTTAARADSPRIDYFGNNLFLGIIYHRYACLSDGKVLTSDNTYQGFAAAHHCVRGTPFEDQLKRADLYLGWTYAESDASLGSHFCEANYDYGLVLSGADPSNSINYCHSKQTQYANNDTLSIDNQPTHGAPRACAYDIFTNCNSDCWIRDFSTRAGGAFDSDGAAIPSVAIASPCW